MTIRTTPMRDADAFSASDPSRTIFCSFLPILEEKQPEFAVVSVSETEIPTSTAAKRARSYVTCIKIAVLETKNSKIRTFFTFLGYYKICFQNVTEQIGRVFGRRFLFFLNF